MSAPTLPTPDAHTLSVASGEPLRQKTPARHVEPAPRRGSPGGAAVFALVLVLGTAALWLATRQAWQEHRTRGHARRHEAALGPPDGTPSAPLTGQRLAPAYCSPLRIK